MSPVFLLNRLTGETPVPLRDLPKILDLSLAILYGNRGTWRRQPELCHPVFLAKQHQFVALLLYSNNPALTQDIGIWRAKNFDFKL